MYAAHACPEQAPIGCGAVTNEPGAAAGWYADPMGRYEHRYYNGREWTADVSGGGQRFVDPLGLTPTPFPNGRNDGAGDAGGNGGGRNGAATTAMVLGIIALSIAWIPFLFVLGVIAAVLALIFATIGWRRAGAAGAGRSFAVVGFATAGSALVAAVLGGILSVVVLDVYDRYLNPQPNEVVVTSCELAGSRATMTGELTNTGDDTSSYSVQVGFVRPGTDNPHRSELVAIDDVAAGDSTTFEAQSQVDLDEVDCVILEVTGPLPFGLDVD
jgi:Protein of unknown function (DUF2510)